MVSRLSLKPCDDRDRACIIAWRQIRDREPQLGRGGDGPQNIGIDGAVGAAAGLLGIGILNGICRRVRNGRASST